MEKMLDMLTKKYICCCSGGKDSTAMFLKILETKRPLDLVVICDIKEVENDK